MDNLKPHKLALMFPAIPPEEFKKIVADIEEKGCFEPVWTYEGKVLDGWHRYQACKKAEIEPKLREYRGDDPRGFVVSMNIMRRHLGAEQRAAFVALAAKKAGTLARLEVGNVGAQVSGRDDHDQTVRTPDVQKEANVGEATARLAVSVADERPDLAEKVVAGDLSLTAADRLMRPKPKRSPAADWKQSGEVKELLEFVRAWRESLPDTIRMVKAGKLSPEAKRFLAAKIRPMADMLAKFADWLEA